MCYRYQTRMYIRLFSGVANSQPTMYAHPVPIWVDGLDGLKAEQVLPGWIS
jgi:hypothetical protein